MNRQAPTAPAAASDRRTRLGERLRQLRRARGLTLQDVASRAGLAVSTVSKVERGLMAPTYDRFSQLAEGLGVDIAELFSEQGERFRPGEFAVARRGDYQLHETENYVYEMLFPQVWGKAMTPMMGDLRAFETMRFDRFVSHRGEEFLLVLSGRVTVSLEDMPAVVLETGESVYFDSRRGHLYAAADGGGARILVVCARLDDPPRNQPPPSGASGPAAG